MAREFAKKFYHSKEWKRIRDIAFERDKGLCQKCLIEKGEHVPGEEVHHMIWLRPSNINDPNITLNLDNLITLCKDCHINLHKNSTHRRKTHTVMNGTYIDEQGQIQKQKIIIVHGAPASGKTTYVHKHREPGDLIVDLDAIKDAISDCARESPDVLLDTALEVRELLYKLIAERKVDAKRIWIIALLPTRAERRELKARLNADELIHIDTGIDDCISNMLADKKRKDKEKEMKIIDDYFGHYQPPL